MTAPVTRRVHVLRDTCSPIFFLTCATGCRDGEFCMDMEPANHGRAPVKPPKMGCWLGSSTTVAGAKELAWSRGYEVAA